MDYAGLAIGLALPWLLGWSALLVLGWPRTTAAEDNGAAALQLGYGYFIGALLLTMWMRMVSAAGMHFGWTTIGAPLLVIAALLLGLAWRHRRLPRLANAMSFPYPDRLRRLLWTGLAVWIALRLASVGFEVALRPIYPWNAWSELAPMARVSYELGHIVPFVDADTWLAGAAGAYFVATPGNPATVPLLQVWSCVALGRWDDSAMNWPWLLMLIALAFSVYGSLREYGSKPLAALVGVWLVVSLPLLDVQVALSGYPDLMLASVYVLAALALYRWSLHRNATDACLAAILALCCPLIKNSGTFWGVTLLPGIVAALLPERGIKVLGAALGAATLLLLAVGRWGSAILGRDLGLEFAPHWRSLVDGLFFFDNWHLLWYGAIALAILGARYLIRRPLAPLAMIVVAAVAFLFVAFSYPAVAAWIGDSAAISRAALPLAPLLICLGLLLWNELTRPAPATAPTTASGDGMPATADA
jgi:hypothetical protein